MAHNTIQELEDAISNFERSLPALKEFLSAAKRFGAISTNNSAPKTPVRVSKPVAGNEEDRFTDFIITALKASPGLTNKDIDRIGRKEGKITASTPDRKISFTMGYMKRKGLVEGNGVSGFHLTPKGRSR